MENPLPKDCPRRVSCDKSELGHFHPFSQNFPILKASKCLSLKLELTVWKIKLSNNSQSI